jgi:hypothetical protein
MVWRGLDASSKQKRRRALGHSLKILSLFFLLAGCAPAQGNYQSILQKAARVDFSKPLGKEDALLLAQRQMILKELGRKYDIARPKTIEEKEMFYRWRMICWIITFSPTQQSANTKDFEICLDKNNEGAVECFDEKK